MQRYITARRTGVQVPLKIFVKKQGRHCPHISEIFKEKMMNRVRSYFIIYRTVIAY